MPGEATNVRGPCSSCGAQLATNQRYCVECGQRAGPPMALPYALPATAGAAAPTATGGWMAALPVPLQTLSAFAALALGFGFVVGTAISPNLGGTIAAQSPTVVAQAPPAPQTPAPPATGGGGGGGTALASSAPAASFAPTTISSGAGGGSGGGGGGGGGGKKKKKKQKQQPIAYDGIVVRVNPVAQSSTPADEFVGSGLVAGVSVEAARRRSRRPRPSNSPARWCASTRSLRATRSPPTAD